MFPKPKSMDRTTKRPAWRLAAAFLVVTFFSHWLYVATKECKPEDEIISFYDGKKIKNVNAVPIQKPVDNYLECKNRVEYDFDVEDLKMCHLSPEDIVRYAPLNGNYRRYKHASADCNIPKEIKDSLINNIIQIPSDVVAVHEMIENKLPYIKNRVGYFIVLILDSERTAEWSFKQLVEVIYYLSPNDVFLSLFDAGYSDATRDIAVECKEFVRKMNLANFHIMLSSKRVPDMHPLDLDSFNFNDMLEPFYHFYMDPNSKPYGTDRVYMRQEQWEEIKNIRLPPSIDKVILLRNQYFCSRQILELLLHSFHHSADITTPMQVVVNSKTNKLDMSDVWNFREVNGGPLSESSKSQIVDNKTFQVMCSWSDMAIINPKAFLVDGIRFRRGRNQVKNDQKRPGECSADVMFSMCMDFIKLGYTKHVMVSGIRTSKEKESFLAIKDGIHKNTNLETIEFKQLGKRVECQPLYENTQLNMEDVYMNDIQ